MALMAGTTGAVVAPVATTISCSLFQNSTKSSLEFWNYVDYMSPDTIDNMKKAYNYYPFGDLPELEQAIRDEVTVGGVGSDYFNASLAGKGLIGKLDFAKLYGLSQDRTQWRAELEELYSPATWKLLSSFELTKMDKDGYPVIVKLDSNGDEVTDGDGNTVYVRADSSTPADKLIHDVDGDGADDFLWEFMAPYFIQNKVVGVNINRLYNALKASNPALAKKLLADPNVEPTSAPLARNKGDKGLQWDGFIDQVAFETWFQNQLPHGQKATYSNIIPTLQTLGIKTFSVNNYMRDNLMIGAEIKTGNMSGEIADLQTAKNYISSFKGTVLKGWDKYQFIDSGVQNLESLIVRGSTTVDGQYSVGAALMYNGDALMAASGGDDTKNGDAGVTRFITPENPSFLLDGIVMAKYVENDYVESNRFYTSLNTNLFRGAMFSVKETKPTTATNPLPGDKPSAYISGNRLYQNFDYVNYSAAFNQLDQYVSDNYFGDKTKPAEFDVTAEAIYSSTSNLASKVDKDHLTQPIDSDLMVNVQDIYESIVK